MTPHTCPACGHVLDALLAFPEAWRAYQAHLWGANWAVCRKTPRTRARYARCVTRNEYDRAKRQFAAGARAP